MSDIHYNVTGSFTVKNSSKKAVEDLFAPIMGPTFFLSLEKQTKKTSTFDLGGKVTEDTGSLIDWDEILEKLPEFVVKPTELQAHTFDGGESDGTLVYSIEPNKKVEWKRVED